MNDNPIRKTIPALACALLLAAWCGPARAQGKAKDLARDMVDQVLRQPEKVRDGDLDAWSRSVIERALERAGKNAPGASGPLPAERHAGRVARGLSARPHGPEVIVFMSLSAPAASWRQWSREAARIGAPLVLRGLGPDGLQATVKRIGPYLGRKSGATIDPRLFRIFDIDGDPGRRGGPGREFRLAGAGAAQRIPRRPTTASRGTSAWKRRSRPSPPREGRAARPRAAISQA